MHIVICMDFGKNNSEWMITKASVHGCPMGLTFFTLQDTLEGEET